MAKRFQDKLVWQPWFAWHPIMVGHQIVWLETVERQADENTLVTQGIFDWEYRYPTGYGESV